MRKIAGTYALISVGGNIANFNGYVRLNETAAFIWQQMQTPKTLDELVKAMTSEFDVSPLQAETDIKEILDVLIGKKMVIPDG